MAKINRFKEKIRKIKDKINNFMLVFVMIYIIVIINMMCIIWTCLLIYGLECLTTSLIITAHGFAWLGFFFLAKNTSF